MKGDAVEITTRAYERARKGDHRAVADLVAADATWGPAREGAWKPCSHRDEIVRTLLWRAGPANRLRPGETIDLGDRVLFKMKGKRLERLGAKGLLTPKLFQIVEVRNGQIVRMQDYARREEALAAAGLQA